MIENITDRKFAQLFTSVGGLILSWSMAERAVDECNLVFFQDAGGSQIEPELPRMLKRKIGFARRCLKNLPSLSTFEIIGIPLLDEMSRISTLRHTVVHGTIINYDKDGTVFYFEMLDTLKMGHARKTHAVPRQTLLTVGQECLELADRLDAFAQSIVRAFMT